MTDNKLAAYTTLEACIYNDYKVVMVGETVSYSKAKTCRHCGSVINPGDLSSEIAEIRYYGPATRNQNFGYSMRLVLDNGDRLLGSNGGFYYDPWD